MSAALPTTPIGKEQVIDLKAGAILRENARKSNLFYGCPLSVVLVLIVLIKCVLLSSWIVREYDTFDFRCSAWNDGGQIEFPYRTKRWAHFYGYGEDADFEKAEKNLKNNEDFDDVREEETDAKERKRRATPYETSDPRKFSKNPDDDDDDNTKSDVIKKLKKKKKPMYGRSTSKSSDTSSAPPKIDPRLDFGPLPPTFQRRIDSNHIPDLNEDRSDLDDLPLTTMVTLTNTQIVQLSGEDSGVVKMKTIRNRVEKVGSDEEQFIEIDIANAPRIYVSKIKSRHGGEQEEHFDLLKELRNDEKAGKEKKKRKGKGKGRKKTTKSPESLDSSDAKLLNSENSENLENSPRKLKGKGLKKSRKQQKTMANQEEVTKQPRHLFGKSSSLPPTTPRPKSSWINGVIDPKDPMFTNQGQIRGYQMQKASKKPSTTTVTSVAASYSSEEMDDLKISKSTRMMWDMDELKYTTFLAPKATEQTRIVGGEEGVKQKWETRVGGDGVVPSSTVMTTTEKLFPGGLSKLQWEQKKEEFEAYTPRIDTPDVEPSSLPPSSTSTSSPAKPPKIHFVPQPTSEAPYYVEVNDADTETIFVKDVTPMFRNAFKEESETTTPTYDPMHLEMEIAKLKESSTCLARMAFDVWCLFVVFSAVPFLIGICAPRWSLFVLHIVFDFLFLVVGFVSSLTIAIMSSIMYFLIEEMTADSLFEFLLVAFVIDIVLIAYAVIVGIAYRCCCRIVDNCGKNTQYTVSHSNGDAV